MIIGRQILIRTIAILAMIWGGPFLLVIVILNVHSIGTLLFGCAASLTNMLASATLLTVPLDSPFMPLPLPDDQPS
jgi:hypothetical protein